MAAAAASQLREMRGQLQQQFDGQIKRLRAAGASEAQVQQARQQMGPWFAVFDQVAGSFDQTAGDLRGQGQRAFGDALDALKDDPNLHRQVRRQIARRLEKLAKRLSR